MVKNSTGSEQLLYSLLNAEPMYSYLKRTRLFMSLVTKEEKRILAYLHFITISSSYITCVQTGNQLNLLIEYRNLLMHSLKIIHQTNKIRCRSKKQSQRQQGLVKLLTYCSMMTLFVHIMNTWSGTLHIKPLCMYEYIHYIQGTVCRRGFLSAYEKCLVISTAGPCSDGVERLFL